MTEQTETREQRFKRIVHELNEKTGFNFTLDELNPDESYEYAHATYEDGTCKITCQMDTRTDEPYAFYARFDGIRGEININTTTKKDLELITASDAFKKRMAALKLLDDLKVRLENDYHQLSQNLITDALSENEMQDAYDTITFGARKLLQKA